LIEHVTPKLYIPMSYNRMGGRDSTNYVMW
jgi:hypothetical protein